MSSKQHQRQTSNNLAPAALFLCDHSRDFDIDELPQFCLNAATTLRQLQQQQQEHDEEKQSQLLLSRVEQQVVTFIDNQSNDQEACWFHIFIAMALARDCAMIQCQTSGKQRKYKQVQQSAYKALEWIQNINQLLQQQQSNSNNNNDSHQETNNTNINIKSPSTTTADEPDENKISENKIQEAILQDNPRLFVTAQAFLGYAFCKQKKYAVATTHLNAALEEYSSSLLSPEYRTIVQQSLTQCNSINATSLLDPPPLIKYPRTTHLIDLGASTDDDQINTDAGLLHTLCNGQTRFTIEEKIDGANLGISLCPKTGQLWIQNRSHYVHHTGGSVGKEDQQQAQFGAPLIQWIHQHQDSLRKVLRDGDWILFGEWVIARHSIPYQRLPGYFVAFDLYDRTQQQFLCRNRFQQALLQVKNVGNNSDNLVIPMVPIIRKDVTFGPYNHQHNNHARGDAIKVTQHGFQQDIQHLLANIPSRFRNDNGPMEGIVLRIDGKEWLQDKYKIVRSDFIAGCANGHWSKRIMEKQQLDFAFGQEYCLQQQQQAMNRHSYSFKNNDNDNNQKDSKAETTTLQEEGDSKLPASRRRAVAKKSKSASSHRILPQCVMLMGLPGSGKSYFASHLAKSQGYLHVNQDIMGKKEALLQASKASSKTRVILDRCHATIRERKEWLDVIHSPTRGNVALVWFTANAETCIGRVMKRVNHSTIPAGTGRRIVERIAQSLEGVTQEERNQVFGTVELVDSFQQSNALLEKWGVKVNP